jgi:hypothetical protein
MWRRANFAESMVQVVRPVSGTALNKRQTGARTLDRQC